MPRELQLSTTSYALLGQMALHPWATYEMTKNMRRTLHWFWPRAESVLYSETKKLARMGLLEDEPAPGRRGGQQTVYTITKEGRAELERWLKTAPSELSLHFEALLRVHLAPYGSKSELIDALTVARDDAEGLLKQALVIGTEFAQGRHQFQEQAHIRVILFDFLWSFGALTFQWADKWIETVEKWPSLESSAEARHEAADLFRDAVARTQALIDVRSD